MRSEIRDEIALINYMRYTFLGRVPLGNLELMSVYKLSRISGHGRDVLYLNTDSQAWEEQTDGADAVLIAASATFLRGVGHNGHCVYTRYVRERG